MGMPGYVDKNAVVSMLRARRMDARADWVQRELPDSIDVYRNHALFDLLGVDPAAIAPVDPETPVDAKEPYPPSTVPAVGLGRHAKPTKRAKPASTTGSTTPPKSPE